MSDSGAGGPTDAGDDAEATGDPVGGGGLNATADDVTPPEDAFAIGDLVGSPRALHPLTIPYRLGQQGVAVVFFVLFAGVPSLSRVLGPRGRVFALGGFGLVVAAVVAYSVTWYRRYEYELTPETFDIRSGVLSRREREIPLRRIQNVDISQSVVQRLLGIAVVNLETAGGGQTEAQLQHVGADEAERLQAAVSRLRREGADSAAEAEQAAETVFEMTQRELGVLAVVSTDIRFVSLLFFAGSLFGPQVYSTMDATVFASPETVLAAFLGPVAGIAGVLVIGLVSGLVNAARYYGFRLTRGEEELRYERGLLQKYSGTIPLSKVQTLTVRENVLARRLGYAALYIETAGRVTGSGDSGGSQSAIPLADRDRVHDLARSIEPAALDEFQRPPKRARQRYVARYLVALAVLTGLVYLVTRPWGVDSWWLPLVAVPLVPVAAHLKWTHRGFAVGEDHVVTRNGFWSRRTKVVPYHRVQTSVSTETVFQRRRDLGTVVVDTAGSRSFTGDDPKAVDVDVATANDLRESVADSLYAALDERKRGRRPSGGGPSAVTTGTPSGRDDPGPAGTGD
ncbi:hypothetical protein BRC64_10385 [Halobacteriales archaeon QH_10_67_22]|nr:MAG: hypothetical protein BRC64_10385 [Halobacteriales archaeon QH_10_67_22]